MMTPPVSCSHPAAPGLHADGAHRHRRETVEVPDQRGEGRPAPGSASVDAGRHRAGGRHRLLRRRPRLAGRQDDRRPEAFLPLLHHRRTGRHHGRTPHSHHAGPAGPRDEPLPPAPSTWSPTAPKRSRSASSTPTCAGSPPATTSASSADATTPSPASSASLGTAPSKSSWTPRARRRSTRPAPATSSSPTSAASTALRRRPWGCWPSRSNWSPPKTAPRHDRPAQPQQSTRPQLHRSQSPGPHHRVAGGYLLRRPQSIRSSRRLDWS